MDERPEWAYNRYVEWGFIDGCNHAPNGVWIWQGFEHHWDVLPLVHTDWKIILLIQPDYNDWHFENWTKVLENRCSHKSKDDFCVLFHSEKQYESGKKFGWFGFLKDKPLYPPRKNGEPEWITYLRLKELSRVHIFKKEITSFAPQYKIPHELEWKMEEPSWKFKGNAILSCFWDLGTIRIWILENLEHNWDILPYFRPGRDIIYVIMAWHMIPWNFDYVANSMRSQNPKFPLSDIVYLCNTPEYIPMAYNAGMRAIYVNQNTFVDEHMFCIKPDIPRKYECIVNSRPEWWKRTILVRNIPNVAIIKGFVFEEDQVISLEKWVNPIWINQERINAEEVCQKLNESHMGGIFSEVEGACFSSSEYLLCGLPVLSTESTGGRDIWYNSENSVIVKPDTSSVREGWLQIKGRLNNGDFNRSKIRASHILLQRKFRKTFLDSIQNELHIRGIYKSMKEISTYFQQNFFHTMRRIILYQEAVEWIRDNKQPEFIKQIKPRKVEKYPFI